MVTKEEINKACDKLTDEVNRSTKVDTTSFYGLCGMFNYDLEYIIIRLYPSGFTKTVNWKRFFLLDCLKDVILSLTGYFYPSSYTSIEETYSNWYVIRAGWVEEIREYLLSLIKE